MRWCSSTMPWHGKWQQRSTYHFVERLACSSMPNGPAWWQPFFRCWINSKRYGPASACAPAKRFSPWQVKRRKHFWRNIASHALWSSGDRSTIGRQMRSVMPGVDKGSRNAASCWRTSGANRSNRKICVTRARETRSVRASSAGVSCSCCNLFCHSCARITGLR